MDSIENTEHPYILLLSYSKLTSKIKNVNLGNFYTLCLNSLASFLMLDGKLTEDILRGKKTEITFKCNLL